MNLHTHNRKSPQFYRFPREFARPLCIDIVPRLHLNLHHVSALGSPKYAIINGTVKDISPTTIETYQKHGVSLFKTHEDGAVTFTIDEDGIKVSKFLGQN